MSYLSLFAIKKHVYLYQESAGFFSTKENNSDIYFVLEAITHNEIMHQSIPKVNVKDFLWNWSLQITLSRNNKYLMTDLKGNSESCFPETLNVPLGEDTSNKKMRPIGAGPKFALSILTRTAS